MEARARRRRRRRRRHPPAAVCPRRPARRRSVRTRADLCVMDAARNGRLGRTGAAAPLACCCHAARWAERLVRRRSKRSTPAARRSTPPRACRERTTWRRREAGGCGGGSQPWRNQRAAVSQRAFRVDHDLLTDTRGKALSCEELRSSCPASFTTCIRMPITRFQSRCLRFDPRCGPTPKLHLSQTTPLSSSLYAKPTAGMPVPEAPGWVSPRVP